MMKRLAILILVAGLGWSAHWFWGKQVLSSAFESWFAERRDDGWQADYADMAIRGFPNRHDTTWTDLEIHDPDSGYGWRAPFFQLFLLSYNRHHAIATWPDRQVITTPQGDIEVTSDSLQASLITSGDDHVPDRANLAADTLALTRGGSTTTLTSLRAGMQRSGPATYDIAVTVDGLALPAGITRAIGDALPATFEKARLQVQIGLSEDWTLTTGNTRPQPRRVDLALAELEWGPMALRVSGALQIDAEGRGTGAIDLEAANWQDMLAVARASGSVPDFVIDGLEAALPILAGITGSRDTLDVTLTLDRGEMRLGPLPIGEAPRLLIP